MPPLVDTKKTREAPVLHLATTNQGSNEGGYPIHEDTVGHYKYTSMGRTALHVDLGGHMEYH